MHTDQQHKIIIEPIIQFLLQNFSILQHLATGIDMWNKVEKNYSSIILDVKFLELDMLYIATSKGQHALFPSERTCKLPVISSFWS